jgi:hypothetical protein
MKKVLLAFSVFLFTSTLYAQRLEYASIKLETKEDYTAEVDKAVLEAATYLLATPLDKEKESWQGAAQFLVRWMSGTPAYTFNIDKVATDISKNKEDLLIIYLAAMVRYSLENPSTKKDEIKVKVGTVRSVLDYCRQQSIKLTGELKRLGQADEKGDLETYLLKKS